MNDGEKWTGKNVEDVVMARFNFNEVLKTISCMTETWMSLPHLHHDIR
jgi:hypothetical protein